MNCPKCGKNLALVGRVHLCAPGVNNTEGPKSVVNTPRPVINKAPTVVNMVKPVINTQTRQAKWREANRDLANARSRDCMRRKREKVSA